jgi:hypothetical protein
VDVEAARDAALAALRALPTRESLPEQRAELLAVAWHCGERNVAALSRAAGVSRDVVYEDLRRKGIDPADDRYGPVLPRWRPLDPATVRRAADAVAGALSPAMLTETPDPVAVAAWQAGIALLRVAEAIAAGDDVERAEVLRDLAVRGDMVRRYAHQALAEQVPLEQAAATLAREKRLAYESDETVVTSATLYVNLPDDKSTKVLIGTRGAGAGEMADWPTWVTTSGIVLPALTTKVYAEIHAAFANLAALIDAASTHEND